MAERTEPAERETCLPDSDEALVARLLVHDTDALAALYDRYARALLSLALRLLGDHRIAEEVVQECFVKLWRAPQQYQPERGRLLTWLLGVTHHRAIDELRRRRSEQRVIEAGLQEAIVQARVEEDPLQGMWREQQRESVGRALSALPPAQQQVLHLAYFEGMTQGEIADFLGEPLGTVKTRARLGMRKLRELTEVDRG